MANVHELDHIKIDLNDQPRPSSSPKSSQLPSGVNRSIHSSKINFKLEYYLTLVRASRGAALLKLVDDLLGSEGVYVFSELLNTEPIKELANHPGDSRYHELLEIFAYGSWRQYRERQDRLPKLSENQTRKLKLLSLIHRATYSRIIPYHELLEELEISETQDLEELTIEGIYNNLIKGRLDQKHSRLEVESCMGRDVQLKPAALNTNSNKTGGDVDMDRNNLGHNELSPAANTVGELQSKLVSWSDCIAKVLNQLDVQIELIRDKERTKVETEAAQAATVESIAQKVYSSLSSSTSLNNNQSPSHRKLKEKEDSSSSNHLMDIDDPEIACNTRKRTRP